MDLKIVNDNSFSGAPSGVVTAENIAANIIDAMITDPITVTLDVGWGEYHNNPVTGNILAETQLNGGDYYSFDQIKSDLKSNTADTASFLQSLNAMSDPANGGKYFLSYAQEKGLGLKSATSTETDAYVGIGTSFNYAYNQNPTASTYDLVGILLHEFTHGLGRSMSPGVVSLMDLMSYDNSNGKIDLTNGTNDKYISFDGGKTNVMNMNTSSDPADNRGDTTDPFNAFLSTNTFYGWTAYDSRIMNVLGFDVSNQQSPPPPPPPPNPKIVTTDGPTITDMNGNTWALKNGQIVTNGNIDHTTRRVVALVFQGGNTVWQENADLRWWYKESPNDTWVENDHPPFNQPKLNVSANNTLLINSNQTIVDAHQNTWSIVNGVIWVNGHQDSTTRNVNELAYVNGRVWQRALKNGQELWWEKSKPSDTWYPGPGTHKAPFTGPTSPPDPAIITPTSDMIAHNSTPSFLHSATTSNIIVPSITLASNPFTAADTAPVMPSLSSYEQPTVMTGSVYNYLDPTHPMLAHA